MAEEFTTREVAKITGLSESRVRYCARAGLVVPRGREFGLLRYSFRDLILLKTAKRLLDDGIPLRRIRRAFHQLYHQEAQTSLTGFAFAADGHGIVAASGGARWRVESGQLVMNFARPGDSGGAVVERLARPEGPPRLTADQWYDLGVELEPTSPTTAADAYRRALEHDAGLVEAHINLGRLLHISGELDLARQHYAQAMEMEPLDAIPAFNLGVIFEDMGQPDEAFGMYEEALQRDELLADAHYNIALLYERWGRRWEALRHLRTFKQLTDSPSGGVS